MGVWVTKGKKIAGFVSLLLLKEKKRKEMGVGFVSFVYLIK